MEVNMKNIIKKICLILALILSLSVLLFGCNKKEEEPGTPATYRFTAPEGTPALAILRLCTDNKTISGHEMQYEIVAPSNIAAEMSSKKSDLVIMPVNAGANLIKQGADYKLVSIAVDGSLYMVGRTETGGDILFGDIVGKKVACIGKTGVPGLIFRYLLKKNGLTAIEEGTPDETKNEVLVTYVADGPAAKTLLANRSEGGVDFAVVGEPAATTFLSAAPLGLNAKMDLQEKYKNVTENVVAPYPQAGLFVKKEIAENTSFMNELYSALNASKEWVVSHPSEVDAFAKANLYESAVFPAASIQNCAVNGQKITASGKEQVIILLNNIAPKDANGNQNDWNSLRGKLFINE